MASGIDGIALASIAAGALFVYAGIKGQSVIKSVQNIVAGAPPGTGQQVLTSPAGGTITSSGGQPSGSDAANKQLGQQMAAAYGWSTGNEWTALNNIVMAESGWSSTVVNPTSTAAGIAQNINGFGPGYERGNAGQQIQWLLQYIKGRYGDPVAAWQFHLAHGWY